MIRHELEAREAEYLAPYASRSRESRGRLRAESEDPIRPAFQRDRDRILHSKAFRRLKHKTQVFFSPAGDHYRTRLTHTLEVAQIARTVSKVLGLNEELTEAIALGHDLGHTPFGHAGEAVLDRLMPGGFSHYGHSLRIVDVLERDHRGLNLTWEVRNGIAKHSKGRDGAPLGMEPSRRAATLEGQVARVADMIAYVNHDIDDAVRAGVIDTSDLPPAALERLGRTSSERIGTLVSDVVTATRATRPDVELHMSPPVLEALTALRAFLFEAVYENRVATAEFAKASGIIGGLWERVRQAPDAFLDVRTLESDGPDAAARDFIAGMTDRFAVHLYKRLFIPRPWATGADSRENEGADARAAGVPPALGATGTKP
jgi:dGTPase